MHTRISYDNYIYLCIYYLLLYIYIYVYIYIMLLMTDGAFMYI